MKFKLQHTNFPLYKTKQKHKINFPKDLKRHLALFAL